MEHAPSHPKVSSKDGKTVLEDRGRTSIPAKASTDGEAISSTCPYDGTTAAARHDFLPPIMITRSGSQGKKIATEGIGD